jgi:hypothetical protein
MKTKFNEVQLARITEIQQSRGITRKSAVKEFQKELRKAKAPRTPSTDVKSRAANDDTNKAPKATDKKVTTPKPPVPSTPAGDARKEGIRLFALAGKPKKADFIHVYGPMGAKWTWIARAKAVGLNTAEEAASQFQKMRAGKPGQFVKAEPPPEKK